MEQIRAEGGFLPNATADDYDEKIRQWSVNGTYICSPPIVYCWIF